MIKHLDITFTMTTEHANFNKINLQVSEDKPCLLQISSAAVCRRCQAISTHHGAALWSQNWLASIPSRRNISCIWGAAYHLYTQDICSGEAQVNRWSWSLCQSWAIYDDSFWDKEIHYSNQKAPYLCLLLPWRYTTCVYVHCSWYNYYDFGGWNYLEHVYAWQRAFERERHLYFLVLMQGLSAVSKLATRLSMKFWVSYVWRT